MVRNSKTIRPNVWGCGINIHEIEIKERSPQKSEDRLYSDNLIQRRLEMCDKQHSPEIGLRTLSYS